MRNFLMGLLTTGLLALNVSATWAAQADPIIGYWRTIDDTTGFAKAVVQIQNTENGKYSATIVNTLARPDYIHRPNTAISALPHLLIVKSLGCQYFGIYALLKNQVITVKKCIPMVILLIR